MVSRRLVQFILTLISILILAAIIWFADPVRLISYISKSNIYFIFLGFVASTLATLFRVLKWKVLLKNVNFKELIPIQILGLTISNFTPGKAAEPIKAFILKAIKGIDISKSLPTIIWERILDLIVLITIALLSVNFLALEKSFFMLTLGAVSIFVVFIIVLLVILHSQKLGMKIFRFLKKFPVLKKISDNFIKIFYESKISKKRISLSLVITLIPWILEGFIMYFALLALGINISPFLLAGMIAISTLVGVASFLPGGLGSFEAALVFLLTIMGVESSLSVTGVILGRLLSFWYATLLGGISFLYLSRKINFHELI